MSRRQSERPTRSHSAEQSWDSVTKYAETIMRWSLLVMVLEVFIPSGGLLGFISIAAIVAAVATAFAEQGIGAGLLVLAETAVAVPATLAIAFHLFPATPLGRRILPTPPEAA